MLILGYHCQVYLEVLLDGMFELLLVCHALFPWPNWCVVALEGWVTWLSTQLGVNQCKDDDVWGQCYVPWLIDS